MERRILLTAALVLAGIGLIASGDAFAQSYPSRPIRLLVGLPPGGATDIVARTIGQPLGVRLGQSVVVDNRAGANGNVAVEIAVGAAPNGYTLLHANDSTITINPHIYSKLQFNPMTDLVPVATMVTNQLVLAVNPSAAPVNDVPGFIALARRANPPLFYASIGNGSQHHLGMEMLKQQIGIELTHVPYRGTAQSTLDLLEGRVEMQFGTIPPSLSHIRAGKLRALAVTGAVRNHTLPDVPTIAESGLSGYECSLWQAIVAPAATPPAIVARLNRETIGVLNDPEVRAAFAKHGVEPEPGSPEALGVRIRDDVKKWREVITSAGIREN